MADVVVAGAAGRMGSRVVACLREEPQLRLVAALESPGHPALGRDVGELAGAGHLGVPLSDDAKAALTSGRVLIEFSVPEASLEHLRSLAAVGGRAVIGTTGFSAEQRAEIGQLAGRSAIRLSPNMSVGVNLAFKLLRIMAQALGGEYDVEISETHHRLKQDAPSGTALRMAEIVAEALGRDLDRVAVYGRRGQPGARTREAAGTIRSGMLDPSHVAEGAGPRSDAPGSCPPSTIAAIGLDDRDVSRKPRPALSEPSRRPW